MFLVQKLYISECGMSATNKSGFEDITEVHARLFNHRPFLQGEVKHFLRQDNYSKYRLSNFLFIFREFEEKRGDREVENIFSCLERVSELRDLGLPGLITSATSNRSTNLVANLQVAESMLGRILEQGETGEVEKTLDASREAREKEWTNFLQEVQVRCKKIDQSFKEQEDSIRKKYQDLESGS